MSPPVLRSQEIPGFIPGAGKAPYLSSLQSLSKPKTWVKTQIMRFLKIPSALFIFRLRRGHIFRVFSSGKLRFLQENTTSRAGIWRHHRVPDDPRAEGHRMSCPIPPSLSHSCSLGWLSLPSREAKGARTWHNAPDVPNIYPL